MPEETTTQRYIDRLGLLNDQLDLTRRIVVSLVHDQPETQKGDYAKQIMWTILPSVSMIIWGQSDNNSLAVMNGLRTLLECWGNTNYIFRSGSRGSEYYLTQMAEGAHQYQVEFDELRADPSLGLSHLQSIRWSGRGPTARVEQLGEGPSFQYEHTSRYVHADVWATLNEFNIADRDYSKIELLGWAVEFINHTLYLLNDENIFGESLRNDVSDLNDRVNDHFSNERTDPTQTS